MVYVKVDFNGDMRRMSFKDRPTLPELRGLLNSAYMADMAQYVLTYQDFEGDQIVVLSDRDLREAFEYALTQPGELLRMSLALKGTSQPAQPAPPAQPAQPARPAPAPARPSAEERQRLMQEEREARRAHRRAEHAARIDARREHFRQKQKERESAPAQDASSLLNLVLSGAWPLIAPYWQQLCEAAQNVFSLVMQNDGLRRFVRRVLSPALHNVLTLPFVQCILRQLGVDVADHSDKPGPCSSSSSCGPAREAPASGRCCGARFMPTHPVPVHMAICDGCEERIVGVRFKCAHCPDYDLCENCIALRAPLGHPAAHEFRRVEAFNGQCPRRRGCPRPGFGVFVAPQEEGVKAPVMPTTFVSPANPSPKEEAKVVEAKVEEVKVDEEVKVTVEDEREEEEEEEEEVKVETFEEKVRKVAHNDDEARKLVTLGSMGFDDLNVTVNVLRRNRGNLMATVNDLIRF